MRHHALLLTFFVAMPVFGQGPPPAAVLGEINGSGTPIDLDRPPRPMNGRNDRVPMTPQSNVGELLGVGVLAARGGLPGYGVTWFPAQSIFNQPNSLGLVRQDLSLSTPIYREGCDSTFGLLSIRNSLFYGTARLPDSNRDFPDTLWDINLGFAHAHRFENRWTAGVVMTGGSASDQPFESPGVLNASVFGYLSIPAIDRDAWLLGVYYSPTSDFPYPTPALGYYFDPGEDFQVNIGLPFFMKYQPTRDLTITAFYLPIRTLYARANWEIFQGFSTYAQFNWSVDTYFLEQRQNNSDRLWGYEKRLAGGLTYDLPWSLRLDLSAGWAFDRFYFQGRRYADRQRDRVSVDPTVFGSIQLRIRF